MDSPDPASIPRILLIDDDPDIARAVGVMLAQAGMALDAAASPSEAYSRLALARYDAILLDLNFTRGTTAGGEGFAALARIMADDPEAAVVVITGHSGIRVAVAAMRAGALDFVMKPWRNADLLERVRAAVSQSRRRAEIAELRRRDPAPEAESLRLLGDSPAMQEVRDLVRRVGPTHASVLVRGPGGAGRTLVARMLHEASPRAASVQVIVEARDEAADLARAAGGALVLRHVDLLDDLAQARLLARLPPDTRLIATAERGDALTPALRARLATVEIVVPPLDRRASDTLVLAHHFARLAERRHDRPPAVFTPEGEAAILAHRWPDEVRGLAAAIERAVVLGEGGRIDVADLGLVADRAEPSAPAAPPSLNLGRSERALVEAALKRHGFNVSHAAAELGLSRAALYRRMAKHGL